MALCMSLGIWCRGSTRPWGGCSSSSNLDIPTITIDAMPFDQTLVDLISSYGQLAVFVGSFFFGETVIISAGFLSATGAWPVENVYLLAFIGTLTSDSVWFLFGQTLVAGTKHFQRSSNRYQRVVSRVERITGDKPFLILLFIKFLYGTRILTILYLAHRKLRFLTFLVFDFLGTILWLAVMVGIGWLAGRGIVNVLPQVKNIQIAFTLLVVVAVFGKLIMVWLKSRKPSVQ